MANFGGSEDRVSSIVCAGSIITSPQPELLGHLDLDNLPVLDHEHDGAELDPANDLRDLGQDVAFLGAEVRQLLVSRRRGRRVVAHGRDTRPERVPLH